MDMVENEKSPETMKAWLGGPLGRLSINPQHCDRIVLCAGGIGCTPMVALAMDQHFRSLNKATSVQVPRVELVWAEWSRTCSRTRIDGSLLQLLARPGVSRDEKQLLLVLVHGDANGARSGVPCRAWLRVCCYRHCCVGILCYWRAHHANVFV